MSQFRVYRILSLESFKGGLISYKYYLSDPNAIRFGISLRARKWGEEESRENFNIDTIYLKQERDHHSNDIEMIAEYLRYFNPRNEIKLFLGVGPRVSLHQYEFTTENIDTLGVGFSYYDSQKEDHNQIGISFSFGVEWFFLSYMSLHAEYGAHFSYFNVERYSKRVYSNPPDLPESFRRDSAKRSGLEFIERGVLFGLSVYF